MSDDKWEWVKEQDLLIENLPLKKWLRDRANKREFKDKIVQPAPFSTEAFEGLVRGHDLAGGKERRKDKFDGKIPEDCFYTEYNESTLRDIMHQQMELIAMLKKHGKSKHMANRLLLIFDDMVGSNLFSDNRDNAFKKLNTSHRHFSASILMVTQGYKEIPKTIRTQYSCLVIFEIPNEKEVEVVFEENPMGMRKDQWHEMYNFAVDGDHNFLFFNIQKPKRLRCMKNFDQVLFFQ